MTGRVRTAEAGFSLIEALVAMALMGVMLSVIASITAQWLPNWNRGFASVQGNELLERGMERLVADLAATEFVPLKSGAGPLYIGSELSVTFVRSAIGPNTQPGLEIVRIAETADKNGSALVRTRARFAPSPRGSDSSSLPLFGDPVVLLRTPYRVTFSYAGDDRVWKDSWRNAARLPRAVRLIVRDSATQQILPVSTVAMLHVDAPPACQPKDGTSTCGNSAPAPAENTTAQAQQ